MKRTQCSACTSTDLEVFLDLGKTPIADAYTLTPNEESNVYPLELAVCGKCRLVQLLEVLSDETLFGTGYSFYSSASPPLSAYAAHYARDVISRYRVLARRGVVEIGCNDGDMLRHFAVEYPTLGIDPAAGPVAAARGRGLNVVCAAFDTKLDLNSLFRKPGVVIANHVLAHVADVNDFLIAAAALMADDGVMMIEVQYLPDLLVNNAFDLVYHEHRNFFSLTSLELALRRVGLHVADAQLTARQGGSLRVTVTKEASPFTFVEWRRVDSLRESERWLQDSGPYAGFQGRVDRIRARLTDLVTEECYDDIIIGYGAPAKATTLLNYCPDVAAIMTYVIDSTPAKQDRFIPGTDLEIVSPDYYDPSNTHLLLAWNYLAQIVRKHSEGRWIIPIPVPVML